MYVGILLSGVGRVFRGAMRVGKVLTVQCKSVRWGLIISGNLEWDVDVHFFWVSVALQVGCGCTVF